MSLFGFSTGALAFESQVAADAIRDELRLARESFGELGAEVARKAGIPATA